LDEIRDRLVASFNQWKARWDARIEALKTNVTNMYNKVATAVKHRLDKILGHRYSQIVISYFKAQHQKVGVYWQSMLIVVFIVRASSVYFLLSEQAPSIMY
jgi:hypothetical protein